MDARAWFNVRMGIVGLLLLALYAPLVGFLLHLGIRPLVALGVLVGGLTVQYWLGKRRALQSVNAQPFPRDSPEADWTRSQLDYLAEKMGVPTPKLWICDTGSPNAFAVGRKGNGHVVLDASLIAILTPDELAAVLAHELSHLRSRDAIPMEIGEGAAAIMFYLFAVLEGLIRDHSSTRPHQSVNSVTGTIAHTLVMCLVFAISRQREYIADADAKWALGRGEPLANALAKIEGLHREGYASDPPEAVEALTISGHWSIPALGSTHPPTERRIAALRDEQSE